MREGHLVWRQKRCDDLEEPQWAPGQMCTTALALALALPAACLLAQQRWVSDRLSGDLMGTVSNMPSTAGAAFHNGC